MNNVGAGGESFSAALHIYGRVEERVLLQEKFHSEETVENVES